MISKQKEGWDKPGVKEAFSKVKIERWANGEMWTDESHIKASATRKRRFASGELSWSDKSRAKASATRKRKLASGEIILKTQNPSKLELNILKIIHELGIECQGQHRIGSRFYDIFIPKSNLLIEVDGEYWHHSEDAIARGIPERDAEKDKIAKDTGYRLIRLRESDIYSIGYKEIVQQRIIPLI